MQFRIYIAIIAFVMILGACHLPASDSLRHCLCLQALGSFITLTTSASKSANHCEKLCEILWGCANTAQIKNLWDVQEEEGKKNREIEII